MTQFDRRGFLLRGMLGGGAVAVGLPFLDYFLDNSGAAVAATYGGGRLPVRFGTWFWGCGMIPDRWQPKKIGADYDLPPQLAPIAAVKQHVSVLTGFDVLLDGKGNLPHLTGNTGVRTGNRPPPNVAAKAEPLLSRNASSRGRPSVTAPPPNMPRSKKPRRVVPCISISQSP